MQTKPSPISIPLAKFRESLSNATLQSGTRSGVELFETQCLLLHTEATELLHQRIEAGVEDSATAAVLIRAMSILECSRSSVSRTLQQLSGERTIRRRDRDEATQFLLTELSDGDRPAKELISLAESIGITYRTLKRAKADLCIISFQSALPNKGHCWVWSLAPARSDSGKMTEPVTNPGKGGHALWPSEVCVGPQTDTLTHQHVVSEPL